MIYEIGQTKESSYDNASFDVCDNKKRIMNQYNNKVILQKVLEMLGASRDFSENDVVLHIITSMFSGKIELFNFFDSFSRQEEITENLENKIKKFVLKNYEVLKDKIIFEDNKDFCIMRIGSKREVGQEEYNSYASSTDSYQNMIASSNSRISTEFLAVELHYDKQLNTVMHRKQEIATCSCEEDDFSRKTFATIYTTSEKYDSKNKLVNEEKQYYYGEIPDSGISFFENAVYHKKTKIDVWGERVKVTQQTFDRTNHEKKDLILLDLALSYEKIYDDYMKGTSFSAGQVEIKEDFSFSPIDERETIPYVTSTYQDLLTENSAIYPTYNNYMGVFYQFDQDLRAKINKGLSTNDYSQKGIKKYQKTKGKVIPI